jgi:hypothetical protein
MGLMYPFPVSTEEADFIVKKDKTLTLKTYGLPYIFWIYALCSLAVVFFMFLAIKAPVHKLIELGDETDALLGNSLLTFIGSLPILIFAFFFYEKRIVAGPQSLRLEYRIFGLRFFSETFQFAPGDHLTVEPFLTSPNVARMKANSDQQGFQNKGYFVLWLKRSDESRIMIDRHSRKVDLEKLKGLLENVINT